MKECAPVRPEAYKYTIASNPYYAFAVGIMPDKTQVLFGVLLPYVVVILFNEDGNLIRLDLRPITDYPLTMGSQNPDKNQDQDLPYPELDLIRRELNAVDTPIHVRKFRVDLPDEKVPPDPWDYDGVAIEDLPCDLKEYLAGECQDEEPGDVEARIREWVARGDFVLWWGNDYFLNREGEVVSS